MSEITYKAIRDRITSEAKEIIGEIEFPKESTQENWEEYQSELEYLKDSEAYEKAHESVDSWDWSIYTYKCFQVFDCLSSSEQCDAEQAFDDAGGYEEFKDGPYELGCAMAYHWLCNELTREIEYQCDELLEMVETKLEEY